MGTDPVPAMSTQEALEEIKDLEQCLEEARCRLLLLDPDATEEEVEKHFEKLRASGRLGPRARNGPRRAGR